MSPFWIGFCWGLGCGLAVAVAVGFYLLNIIANAVPRNLNI